MSATKDKKKTAKRSYMVRRPNPLAKQADKGGGFESDPMGSTMDTIQLPTEKFDDQSYQHQTEPAPLSSRLDFDGADQEYRRGKPIAVARPVKEACNSKTLTGTFDTGAVTKLEPQTLAVGAMGGARRAGDGLLLGHTILGDPHDFDDRLPEDQRQGRPEDTGGLTSAFLDSQQLDDDDSYQSMSNAGSQVGSARKSVRAGRRGSTMSKMSRTQGSMKKGLHSTMGSVAHDLGEDPPPPPGELPGDRQTRALERWDKYQKERDLLASHLKEVRGPKDKRVPVMMSGDEYRERVEEFDLIEKAMPREDKYRDNLWFMSLRDSWARFIPLGSIFSGLFCVVQEKALAEKAFTVVRDPSKPSLVNTKLQYTQARDGSKHQFNVKNNASSIPKSSWVNMEGIWQKEQYLGPNVRELLPFRVDTEGLMVVGSNGIDSALPGEGLVDEYMDDEEKESSVHSRLTKKKSNADGTMKDAESVSGPSLELRDPNVSFDSQPNAVAKERVCVFNNGTTAVHYRWEKIEKQSKLGVPLRGINPIGGGFWCCQEKGVMQPGTGLEFPFAFKSSLCGIYTSVWRMVTIPAMPDSVPPLDVAMRGVVTAPDQNAVKRALLEQHLEHNSVLHGIQDAIMAAIRAVELPAPKAGASEQPPEASRLEAKKFARANTEALVKADVKYLRTLNYHYNPYMLTELHGLAEDTNSFPQLGTNVEPEITMTEEEIAVMEMTAKLTPREACYDPSVENNKQEEESWDEGWTWDYEVASLGERQLTIADETSRATELARLDSAVERAIWHQHRPSALYPPAVDALCELAENIEKVASQTRRRIGLAPKDFVAPEDGEDDPKAAKGKDAKKGKDEEEVEEDDPELLADFHDMLYAKVRELLCNAVDQFADLAGVVMMEEKERRGEGDDD